MENINDLLQENKNIYLQDRLDEPKYDHEELKRWIEAPNYNTEELMKKEWLSYLHFWVKSFDPWN